MPYSIVKTPTAQVYDLPFIGDDLANIGRVIDIWAPNCVPSAEIWVYAFFQQLPTLFITLFKPELIDISIHKGHHRPRKGKRFRLKADAILRDSLIEVPVPNWKVFRLFELGQRIGFYFLVADATETFAINWISTAYMWNGCPAGNWHYATFQNDWALSSLSNIGQEMAFGPVAHFGMGVFPPLFQFLRTGTYRVSWSVQFKSFDPLHPEMVPYTSALVDHLGPPAEALAIGEASQAPNGEWLASGDTIIENLGVSPVFHIIGPSTFNSGLYYFKGSVTVQEVDHNAIGPDP